MALNGRLEDLNLLEILQIVAFAKKTGTLKIEGTVARGAVSFRDGVVLCAVSSTTAAILRSISDAELDPSLAGVLEDQIRLALRELMGVREGRFEFILSAEPPKRFEGMNMEKFLVAGGVDPQQLMLELARELDTARQQSSSLLESSDGTSLAEKGHDSSVATDAPSLEGSGVIVVVVDDEPQVLDVVRTELERAGCAVETAASAADAISLVDKLSDSGQPLILVTDVAMPSCDGETFEGGIEVLERLNALNGHAPALLMTESLATEARERVLKLGVRRVAFKPALTKLDADEYRTDLRSFAGVVRRELTALLERAHEAAHSPVPDLNHTVMFDFLRTMTDQLTQPTNGIARMILRVGAKYCERVALFLVKGPKARGLAALHLGRSSKHATEDVRGIEVDLQEVQSFAEVVYSRSPLTLSHEKNALPLALSPGRAREYALLPLLHNHEVLSIVLCDNPNTGRPLGRLSGLALFVTQAGMAMENASLHQRLRSLENQFSLDNQGPLTQELTQIIRGNP